MAINYCMSCGHSREIGFWFKTPDHYLDSKYDALVKELKAEGFEVKADRKVIKVKKTKEKISLEIHKHECGPEVFFKTIHNLSDNIQLIISIATVISLIIKMLKKLAKERAKERKEKAEYKIILLKDFRRVDLDKSSKEEVIEILKEKHSRR